MSLLKEHWFALTFYKDCTRSAMFLSMHRSPYTGDRAFKSKQTAANIYMVGLVSALNRCSPCQCGHIFIYK